MICIFIDFSHVAPNYQIIEFTVKILYFNHTRIKWKIIKDLVQSSSSDR